jgi:hypothetical protein
MAYPQVADGGDSLQIWRVAANIFIKQLRRAYRRCPSSVDVGWGANNPPPQKMVPVTKYVTEPQNWTDFLYSCEYDDEPLGSSATELVS